MYGPATRAEARTLVAAGLTYEEAAQRLGVSRTSVYRWQNGLSRVRTGFVGPVCLRCTGFPVADGDYAALLGFYLGDGHIARQKGRARVMRLTIYQDARYQESIREIAELQRRVVGSAPGVRTLRGCLGVNCYSTHLLCLFPQHGPGRKHTRPIVLEPWQDEIVAREPGAFLRGLFHSDGCRVVNRVRKGERRYEYPRYLLSNESADILGLAGDALDRLGVPWRLNRPNCLSVARREGVALLDQYVGPKR
ncbi:MAG: helix-turn-helix domain-containing protein [Candidatus Nanopelagicales bacterium]